jgi:cysteinyl-tRNA synthetase
MANTWMHNGFLQVEGEKMSKSLGNFFTINELLTTEKFGGRKWAGEVLRLAMLKTHYRSPIDWTVEGLQESETVLQNWIDLLEVHQTSFGAEVTGDNEILEALLDDLNTSRVMMELHRMAGSAKTGELQAAQRLHSSLEFLGMVSHSSGSTRQKRELSEAAKKLMDLRKQARARKDFKESDRIRDELAAMGVVLKDGKDADGKPVTTWEIAR